MKCPVDGTELLMTERQGVEIDYCPKCRGVWLDRGELDKIIEKATPAVELDDPDPFVAPPPPPSEPVRQSEPRQMRSREEMERGAGMKPGSSRKRRYDDDDDYDDDDYRHAKRYKKKRRKSVLSELFDIFD
ncbi:zf-TFIIB domain-containing protein [Aliiroseovarius sp. S253]|uniref:TFIIB-type zinc ribbon-containing protein n=1 Tax=Aliiroseovarius sp. S253 TaxID=3415133 RepID=UPI003C7B281C